MPSKSSRNYGSSQTAGEKRQRLFAQEVGKADSRAQISREKFLIAGH